LRAAWARRGEQRVVVVSGRTSRRVVHGALNAATGDFVALIRERRRQDDGAAFGHALGQGRPDVPKLLVWDNAPPHHPKRVQAAAAAANIRMVFFLPLRAPELMPCEDLRGPVAAGQGTGRRQSGLHGDPGAGRARRCLARCPIPLRPFAQNRPVRPNVSVASYLGFVDERKTASRIRSPSGASHQWYTSRDSLAWVLCHNNRGSARTGCAPSMRGSGGYLSLPRCGTPPMG
jgi:DDE superfamily endonuclease